MAVAKIQATSLSLNPTPDLAMHLQRRQRDRLTRKGQGESKTA